MNFSGLISARTGAYLQQTLQKLGRGPDWGGGWGLELMVENSPNVSSLSKHFSSKFLTPVTPPTPPERPPPPSPPTPHVYVFFCVWSDDVCLRCSFDPCELHTTTYSCAPRPASRGGRAISFIIQASTLGFGVFGRRNLEFRINCLGLKFLVWGSEKLQASKRKASEETHNTVEARRWNLIASG